MACHVVARVTEIPVGGRKRVSIDGRGVVVFNVKGEFYALSEQCPHRGGSLAEGIITGLVESDSPGQYRHSRQGEIVHWKGNVERGQWRRVRGRSLHRQDHSGSC